MPAADRTVPATAPTEGENPVNESTVRPADAAHVHRLLEEAKLLESAFDTGPTPITAAAPTVPVPPPGYTLRTIHRTTADGGSEVSYEVVPLAPIPDFTPSAGPAPIAGHRDLPDWLTANSRKVKAACYLIGGGSLAALAAIYGPAVGAGAAAAAAGLWAATLTGLKFLAAIVVGAVVIGAMAGGKSGSRKPKTGTFEGTVTGTWKQD
ncbi:hypothetical protein [Streptomyces goshikiensis]|uniref:hypothetical protein n=1 Tax=Streptomyces goshikiensis TaxID=1942 RepID=UPI0037BDBB32